MSAEIDAFFAALARIGTPVLTETGAGPQTRSVTGQALAGTLDRLAAWLARQDVRPGDRVVALFDNRLEAALLLLAALRHGVTLCLQPASATPEEVQRIAALAGAAVVVNAGFGARDDALALDLPAVAALEPVAPPDLDRETPFLVTFTSGSTGAPKGIVHAARSFLACAGAFNRQAGIGPGDRFLNVMPMFYMAGVFNGILAPLAATAPVVIAPAFSMAVALRLWALIRETGSTALWLSPTMLAMAVRMDRGDKTLPPGLRRLFVGTGAMARADAQAFHQTYGLAPLQSYGLSELLYISVDDAADPAFGTVGRPLEGVDLSFDDAGTLAIATPYAFLGYLDDGRIRPPPVPFVTTDLAALTPGGRLEILGRSDDVILRGGVNVNPVQIETLLAPVLAGRAFCISALPDPMLGQKVILVLEGPPSDADEATLAAARRAVQAAGRVQIDGLWRVAALPLGPTGKVRRAALRAELADSAAGA